MKLKVIKVTTLQIYAHLKGKSLANHETIPYQILIKKCSKT